MNKIFLALAILGAGAGGIHIARQSTILLQHEAEAAREAWLTQTQLAAAAQSEQAGLTEHIRELKQTLAQSPAVAENALWSALQTNRADRLPPELRERLLEELGFHWKSSPDFIVVSKQAVRSIQMQAIRGGKLTDIAATVLAMTPGERGQVEAAMQRVQADYKDWALSHVERSEPKDDVVAQYTLPNNPAISISNNFAAGLFGAVGLERAELILPSARNWMISSIGLPNNVRGPDEKPMTMIVKRYLAGNEQRLKVQIKYPSGGSTSDDLWRDPQRGLFPFPGAFRPIFPNGWADVAKREGFEMPRESQEK